MQREDLDPLTSQLLLGARVRGQGVKRRPGITIEEVVAEDPAPAKRQLNDEEARQIELARRQEAELAAAQLAALNELPMAMQVETGAGTTTRMAGRGRKGLRIKDLDPAQIEELKAERRKHTEDITAKRRREREEAAARGEATMKSRRRKAHSEVLPSKTRGPAPQVSVSTGREVVPMRKKPRRAELSVPVGIAQRLKYQMEKKLAGLVSKWIRLSKPETQTTKERTMRVKGGRSLGQARLEAAERELAEFKWQVMQDGFYQYLSEINYDRHYLRLPPQPKMDIFPRIEARPGQNMPMGFEHHYVGEAFK